MSSLISIPIQLTTALIVSALFVSGCSSSSSSVAQSPGETEIVNADTMNVPADDGAAGSTSVDTETIDNGSATNTGNGTSDAGSTSGADTTNGADTTQLEPDTSTTPVGSTMVPDTVVPDPLVQNFTVVNFNITVPAYQSDALQVRVVWDDKDFTASWVGDELWSASGEFPTNTENLLVVTFNDGNGETTLGSFEQNFRTGTNDLEVYTVTADQFDTDQWDSDSDGVSNINEGADSGTAARVLLFSETRDFRHDSTEVAVAALEDIASSAGLQADRAGDSAGVFTDANLANYDAVVWVMTSGDVLDSDEQAAFERFIRSGGGYAGIHAASFTEYEWPWYGALVGAYFESHPVIQSATQDVEDSSHLSTAHLDLKWTRTDEWYDYRTNPRAQVNVLLSLDEDSYTGGAMGGDHPSAWYHDYDGGRSWYTGGGHTDASYSEPDFRTHLLGGLTYAAGLGG